MKRDDPKRGGLSPKERELMDRLVASERPVIRTHEVQESWPTSPEAVNAMLSRLARKGWLQRLKRGVYTVVPLGAGTRRPAIARAWPIAAELFAPGFISGWSAAEHWGLTDQIFNAISVVTSRPQRHKDREIGGIHFRVRRLPPGRVYGSVNRWIEGSKVPVADRHRTLIDAMDAPGFAGGGRHTLDIAKAYWDSPEADPGRLLDYARRFGRGAMAKRLGFCAERFGSPGDAWLEELRKELTQGTSLLDPAAPAKGPIEARWRLRVNLPLEEG